MILIILKCYFAIFLSIGVGAVLILTTGVYFIFRKQKINSKLLPEPTVKKQQKSAAQAITITSQDISAIAGDDVMATQLDLARAYIESGRKILAKRILEHVAEFGKIAQQREAQNLLTFLQQETRE